jgi:hypothetical protein
MQWVIEIERITKKADLIRHVGFEQEETGDDGQVRCVALGGCQNP